MSQTPNAPRRIIPTGALGVPETPPPPPGYFRTRTAPRIGPLTADQSLPALGRDTEVERGPDGFLVPPADLWRGYGASRERYFDLATRHVESMLGILNAHAAAPETHQRVLEFGCAACPMLRLLALRRRAWELWGCDIDPAAIDWSRRHLSPALRLFTNTTAPHLPLPGAALDLVYAGSVFSHIEYLADAWLLELARVIRPGGHLFVTIHDKAFIRHTIAHAPAWGLTESIVRHFGTDAADGDWVWRLMGAGPNANAFYDRDFFLRLTSPVFDLVAAIERAYGDQTALLLKRRS
jgi:SAM-dependent methyltransferase